MCNHAYTADYRRMPRAMGQRCPYPGFYQRVCAEAAAGEPAPALPVDLAGECIFHSRDVAWKRANDFEGHFLRLIRLLGADSGAKHYDFAEFVFLGGASDPPMLRIANTVFPRKAYFVAASFLDSVTFEGVDFEDGANFCKNLRGRPSGYQGSL